MKIASVADALAAMDYLHRRELLCERCGIQLATLQNPNHSYCEGCRPPHGEYNSIKPANRLEQWLCDSVNKFMKQVDLEEAFGESD